MIQLPKKQQIFLAYPFTEFEQKGEILQITAKMGHIVNAIQQNGIYCVKFCSIFEEENYKKSNISWQECYKITQAQIPNCGIFASLVPTQTYSKGRDNETLDAYKKGMPIHLFVQENVNWQKLHPNLLDKLEDKTKIKILKYKEIETDLYQKLKEYKF